MIRRLVVLGIFAVVLTLGLVLSQQRHEPLKVSGFIEADEIRLGSRVGGRVRAVNAVEGQRVTAGALLVELDPFDLRERGAEAMAIVAERHASHQKLVAGYRAEARAQAKARRDQLAAHLEKLRTGPRRQEIAAAEADLALAQAELRLAEQRHARVESLLAQGTSTQEEMDQANNQLSVGQAKVAARREQLALLQEGTRAEEIREAEAKLEEAEQAWQELQHGFRAEEIAEAHAALEAARAAQAAVDRQLDELRITAPVTGTVEVVELQPGDLVGANAPALSLLDLSHLWVRAFVPEDQLDVRVDQVVKITVDSYPGESFTGRISYIARQAEFTPGNVQTPEERSKQVFRIKVDLTSGHDKLRPGMAADVWLEPEEPTP